MQAERVPAEEEINACDGSGGADPNACRGSPPVAGENAASQYVTARSNAVKNNFYEKLTKFYEISGLSLIFNFRETKVDLYLFYKDVTARGGYCQVTRDGKWGEVASTLNTISGVLIPPDKIQMLYANLFYQFEQTYYYRTPAKVTESQRLQVAPTGYSSGSRDSSSSSTGKRKHSESVDDGTAEKRVCLKSSFQFSTGMLMTEEKNPFLQTPSQIKEMKKSSIIKEMKKYPNAPRGYRTSYMIFLKMECDRLKKIHGESSAGQFRGMAIEAWRRLSKSEREPYVEASKKDKERYIREMAAYENVRKQNTEETQNASTSSKSSTVISFARPTQTEGIAPADAEDNIVTDESENVHKESMEETQNVSTSSKSSNAIRFARPLQTEGDYHVTLPPDAEENSIMDKSAVELAAGRPSRAEGDYNVILPPDADDTSVTDKSVVELAAGRPLQTDGEYRATLPPDAETNSVMGKSVVELAAGRPSETDGDYHVTLPPDTEDNSVTDKSVVELAAEMVKNAQSVAELAAGMVKNAQPNDPLFQVNWEEYYDSLNIVKKDS